MAQSYPLSEAEKQRRLANLVALGYLQQASDLPEQAIPADANIPANGWHSLPVPFYADEVYQCRDCGKNVVWTALEKFQYYEVEKRNMYARRVRCEACFRKAPQ